MELEDDQALLIVDIPVEEESDSITRDVQMYATLPMGIVVSDQVVVTVCLEDTSVTRDIASGKIVRGIQTAMRTRFVFQLLLRVAGRFLNYLHRIERSFNEIERRLYDSQENEDLMQLLGLQKSLVYFSASLKGNEVTMEKVLRGRILKLYDDDRDLLEDALIEIRQAIEMSGIYSTILAGHNGGIRLGCIQQYERYHESTDGYHPDYDNSEYGIWILWHECAYLPAQSALSCHRVHCRLRDCMALSQET